MKYQAIIFDLDGVICHTDQYHFKAWEHIANQLGIPFDEKANNRLRGVSRRQSLEIILEKYAGILSENEKQKYMDQKNELYKQFLGTMTENDLDAEVKSTLIRLKEYGLKLAIGSSSKNAKYILSRLGLGDFFDAISDGNNISKSKPDPEVFLKASEYLQRSPSKCLVVEDANAGILAATSGGMDSAAIGDAANSKMATYNLASFSDIENIILS